MADPQGHQPENPGCLHTRSHRLAIRLALALSLVPNLGCGRGTERAEAERQVPQSSVVDPTPPPVPLPGNSTNTAAPSPQAEAAQLKRRAIAIAEEVVAAYPENALSYALLGSAYFNTGQAEEAIKHLKRCLELNPNQLEAYEILARVAYEKGEPEETVRLSGEVLKRGAATPDVLNRMGRALMDLGRTDDAVRTLQQATQRTQAVGESFYLLGQARMQSGALAEAKESFLQAIARAPDHTQAFFGLYTACQKLGQTNEAASYRQQFAKLEASNRKELTDQSSEADTLTGLPMVRETVARTFFGAGQIFGSHQQFEKASDNLRRAAILDEGNPTYRAALEALYVQRKLPAAGLKAFQQLIAEQPGNPLNSLYLGRFYTRLEDFDAAERAYNQVRSWAPDQVEGHRALAELYLRMNRKAAEAPELLRRVLELEPSGPHYYLLAMAYAKLQNRTGALEAVQQALARNPGEPRYEQLRQKLQATP